VEEHKTQKITKMKENSWLLKLVNWIAWISGGIGLCFIILGVFQVVFGVILYLQGADRVGAGRIIPETEIINFFIASISFFTVLILWLLIQIRYRLNDTVD
jgi:hypothetical protein